VFELPAHGRLAVTAIQGRGIATDSVIVDPQPGQMVKNGPIQTGQKPWDYQPIKVVCERAAVAWQYSARRRPSGFYPSTVWRRFGQPRVGDRVDGCSAAGAK